MADDPLQRDAWIKLCHLLDGVAVGTTVATLAAGGLFTTLALRPRDIDALAAAHGFAPGYLHLAMRLLALQGWIVRDEGAAALTPAGDAWRRHLDTYTDAPERVAAAITLLPALRGDGPPPLPPSPPVEAGIDLGDVDALPTRVQLHRLGPELAAALAELSRQGVLDAMAEAGEAWQPSTAHHQPAWRLLQAVGWAETDGGQARLTPEGRRLPELAPQAFYSVSYLPLYRAVPRLLAGEGAPELAEGADGGEAHLDRLLDIRFSGIVYRRTCRAPLREVVEPLLRGEAPPRALVDVGCGDATLLLDLHDLAVEAGLPPPRLVGVEYTRDALAEAERRLAPVGGQAVPGDIGEPAAIVAALAGLGLAADDCLFLTKSVIHDRAYRGTAAAFDDPLTKGVFVADDGGLIPPGAIEADLADCFARWAGVLGRHGFVCIEAHLLDETAVASVAGRTPVTGMEATHGYSRQFLVEAEVHRRAAARGGLRAVVSRDLGVLASRPLMTIDVYQHAAPE